MNLNSHHRVDQLGYFLLALLMADCAVLGGGSFFHIGGIDYRIVLFAVLFFVSLPAVFRNLRSLFKNTYFLLLLFWGIWIFMSAFHGYSAGNDPARIISQLVGFAAFAMLPGTICLLSDRNRIKVLMKVLSAASFLLAMQSVIALIIYCVDIDLFVKLNLAIIEAEMGGCTGVTDTLVRIFLRSHPCMVLGCICSFYLACQDENRCHKALYIVNIALCMMSLLMSYTRSLYLGALIGAGLTLALSLFLYRNNPAVKKSILRLTAAIIICFAVMLLIFDLVGHSRYLTYGLYRSTNMEIFNPGGEFTEYIEVPGDDPSATDTTEDLNTLSDDIREKTKEELMERINGKLFTGSGLGSVLNYRAGTDGGNEYFYLDMVFTSGAVGLILFLLPMVLLAVFFIKGFRRRSPEDNGLCIVWLSAFIAIAVFSNYNPYLTGVNGISILCCTIAVFSCLDGQQQLSAKI